MRTVLLATALTSCVAAADPLADRCWEKFNRIDSGQVKRGSVVVFTTAELNAWARSKVPRTVAGVRNPQLQLDNGAATGSALVDFIKMRQGHGTETGAFLEKLIEGERPLKVSVRLESGQGRATVYLTSVDLAGVTISGPILDFLVKNFFMPMFPDAKINQPFELRDNIDRIDVRPDAVRVTMRK